MVGRHALRLHAKAATHVLTARDEVRKKKNTVAGVVDSKGARARGPRGCSRGGTHTCVGRVGRWDRRSGRIGSDVDNSTGIWSIADGRLRMKTSRSSSDERGRWHSRSLISNETIGRGTKIAGEERDQSLRLEGDPESLLATLPFARKLHRLDPPADRKSSKICATSSATSRRVPYESRPDRSTQAWVRRSGRVGRRHEEATRMTTARRRLGRSVVPVAATPRESRYGRSTSGALAIPEDAGWLVAVMAHGRDGTCQFAVASQVELEGFGSRPCSIVPKVAWRTARGSLTTPRSVGVGRAKPCSRGSGAALPGTVSLSAVARRGTATW